MRKNLVIVPVGDNSLHVPWCELANRSYDVWAIYYGDDKDVLSRYATLCEKTMIGKGKKFKLISQVSSQFHAEIEKYDYVWFPDDDLRFHNGPEDLNRMFAKVEDLGADCFQPSIANALISDQQIIGKYCSPNWDLTLHIPGADYHEVTAVEMMMFGFSREGFRRCFRPACVLTRNTRTGWGMEMVIALLLYAWKGSFRGTVVLDSVPIIHTRPLGSDPVHNQQGHEDLKALDIIIGDFQRKTLEIKYKQ